MLKRQRFLTPSFTWEELIARNFATYVFFRRPNQKAWRDTMGLASFIDQHCDPVGHADHLRFVIPPFKTPVTPRPWTTAAKVRATLALANTEEDVDDALALEFISGILDVPGPPRRRLPPLPSSP